MALGPLNLTSMPGGALRQLQEQKTESPVATAGYTEQEAANAPEPIVRAPMPGTSLIAENKPQLDVNTATNMLAQMPPPAPAEAAQMIAAMVAQPQPQGNQTYVVQPGDTLSTIGARFGVPWQSITGFRSGNPNLIYPGEVLTLGAGGRAPAPAAQPQAQPAQGRTDWGPMSSYKAGGNFPGGNIMNRYPAPIFASPGGAAGGQAAYEVGPFSNPVKWAQNKIGKFFSGFGSNNWSLGR